MLALSQTALWEACVQTLIARCRDVHAQWLVGCEVCRVHLLAPSVMTCVIMAVPAGTSLTCGMLPHFLCCPAQNLLRQVLLSFSCLLSHSACGSQLVPHSNHAQAMWSQQVIFCLHIGSFIDLLSSGCLTGTCPSTSSRQGSCLSMHS